MAIHDKTPAHETQTHGATGPLTPRTMAQHLGGPYLAVIVGTEDLPDGRGGIDPRTAAPDDIADRIIRHWNFGSRLSRWSNGTLAPPRALVALSGNTADRWVIGSVDLSDVNWQDEKLEAHNLDLRSAVPAPIDVDCGGLRGQAVTDFTFKISSGGTEVSGLPHTNVKYIDANGVERH